MDLAIYCHMLHKLGKVKLPVVDVVRLSRGRHEFVFDDQDGIIRSLEVQYANSEEANLLAAQKSLKQIMRTRLEGSHERSRRR